jgi:hypothetical protein
LNNPFAKDFSFVSGKGEATPIQLKVYFPNSQKPKQPLNLVVKRDATVEEVIGFALFSYVEEKRLPAMDDKNSFVIAWNLRIVEDDGLIDEDFPGINLNIFNLFSFGTDSKDSKVFV